MTKGCELVGKDSIGALRVLTYTDGSMVVERLEALGEAGHRPSYAPLADAPFRNCLTPSHCTT